MKSLAVLNVNSAMLPPEKGEEKRSQD